MDHPKKKPERVARYHRVSKLDQNPLVDLDAITKLKADGWSLGKIATHLQVAS